MSAQNTVVYGSVAPAYLVCQMFPDATRVASSLGETAGELLERLPFVPERFIFHVSLTDLRNVPWQRERLTEQLAAGGARIVNEGVVDVSKRAVQGHCARLGLPSTLAPREGSPDEMLIVKTDWNCAGIGERILPAAERERIDLAIEPTAAWTKHYPILPRREVAEETWSSRDFIVERYVTNERNVFFRAYLFGDRLVVSRVVDDEPLKRMPEGIPRSDFFFALRGGEPVLVDADEADTPLELAREVALFCRTFRLDFGALDVVRDDAGRHYIIDVNNTPVWGGTGHPDILEFLASGAR